VLRACIDRNGIGMQLAEEARERFGCRVEEVVFTPAVKQELAHPLRARMEDRVIRIPQDQLIRGDLHSVKKVMTASGNVRFDVDRSESGGFHADHFWALALASHAHSLGARVGKPEYHSIQPRRFAEQDPDRMTMRAPAVVPARRSGGAW
jgi:phage FluMu gp28-like protein